MLTLLFNCSTTITHILRTKIASCIGVMFFFFQVTQLQAQNYFLQPARGFVSSKPAANWQHSLLSGNGTVGILVNGKPDNEVISINHALLYLPEKLSGTYVRQGDYIEKIRELLFAGNRGAASGMINTMKTKAGYTDVRDAYIPGFNIKVEQPAKNVAKYQRSVNYETGETIVEWQTDKAMFKRRTFVSRKDSVVVISIKSSEKLNAIISMENVLPNDSKELSLVVNGFSKLESNIVDGWLTYQAAYKNVNTNKPYVGYIGSGKVFNAGGNVRMYRNRVEVTNADSILVLVKIEPVKKLDGKEQANLQKQISACAIDYEKLLERHVEIHKPLFNTVALNLNADKKERELPVEQLIQQSRQQTNASLAMVEKAFDAGRYNIISCVGANPPNLVGIWSSQWASPWLGSFTTNGNLQTSMAFILNGNTPSLMQAYFNMNDGFMEGYRRNAKELFNCRGIHIPAQMTTSPLETDFTPGYTHSYWTGGAGWAANFYYDYYLYTGDQAFLKTKGYPFMKEAALFLEDFLNVEKEGKLVFIPSYSPENAPLGEKNPPATINATMDVAITKQLLRNCIKAAKQLGIDADKISLWNKILAKMPEYQISETGTFKEWLWPGHEESNSHRHASHLYGLYNDIPGEFKSDAIKQAVENTIRERMNFHTSKSGTMAFGMCQLGWSAAHIGNASLCNEAINWQANNYWSEGMASFHDKRNLFNMDISGGFPYMVSQCFVYSEPDYVKLIPALPAHWKSGEINGLKLRGNHLLNGLKWNMENNTVEIEITPGKVGKLSFELPGSIKEVAGIKGVIQGNTCTVDFKSNKPQKLVFSITK